MLYILYSEINLSLLGGCCCMGRGPTELSLVQDCKRHRPDGCEEAYARLRCPVCLILPCLVILQKISNHLELLKGELAPLQTAMLSSLHAWNLQNPFCCVTTACAPACRTGFVHTSGHVC